MRFRRLVPSATLLFALIPVGTADAQQRPESAQVSVPRVVRIAGTFQPTNGLPAAPVEIVTLSIYADEQDGTPLWRETQNVIIGADGRYALLLGSTVAEGLPQVLFASGEARWLGMHFERPGEGEQPRVQLTTVPYALKAVDADTLGGKPASAYLLASSPSETSTTPNQSSTPRSQRRASGVGGDTLGTANFIGKFTDATSLGNSAMYQNGNFIGVGTTAPLDAMHVSFTDPSGAFTGYAVQNKASGPAAYSGMLFYDQNGALGLFQGFNNSTHEYRINNIASSGAINFMLGGSSKFQVRTDGDVDISGSIRKGGVPFFHNVGTENTFLGENAGNLTLTGTFNTASGSNALHGNSTGWFNTASGAHALALSTTGNYNTATGSNALASNTTGSENTATGSHALYHNISGHDNTATGFTALFSNTTGNWNTATGLSTLGSNTAGIGNTASGGYALARNTTGNYNTANGFSALNGNDTGGGNTAIGAEALSFNTTGIGNVAVGNNAGVNATTGSNNIYLGANVLGAAGETNTIYLGVQGTQTKTVVAGIRGITTGIADAVAVVIDSAGQLGTVSSSRRFKQDIHDMGDASRALLRLRPVMFRYTQPFVDGSKPLQYGLIAEEVAEVYPDLVAHSADGQVETVKYQVLDVLLLNEVQRQQSEISAQREQISVQQHQISTQREQMRRLEERLAGLEAALARH